MSTQENKLIFDSLKKVLRNKKITYKSLATKLGIAESSLKRIFSQENCSLEKLIAICEAINLSLSELVQLYQKEGHLPVIRLNQEMEDFFLKNREYLKFYRQFTLYKSVDVIKKKNGLTEKSVKAYADKLVEFGLVEKQGRNKYSLSKEGFVRFSKSSKLSEAIFTEWSQHILHCSLNKRSGYFSNGASTRLTKKSQALLMNEIEQLFQSFKEKGYLENLSDQNKVEPIGLFFASGPEILNFPGAIENI
jgi:DNA-binding Xre family transcriptional regulator